MNVVALTLPALILPVTANEVSVPTLVILGCAAVGLDKSDLDIIVDSETLRVAYRKSDDEKELEANEYRYFHRSIKKAGFDIAWKVSSKYELSKLSASLDKGLLTLEIPFAKENKPKKIEIK